MTDDNKHTCPDCGETYVGKNPLNGHTCSAKVPIEELEQLADEWEVESDKSHNAATKAASSDTHSQRFPEGLTIAYKQCAEELREVLADYE